MATGFNEQYQQPSLTNLPPRFGPNFLEDHTGLIMSDPKIALVELVANAWDAGADRIDITWPEGNQGKIVIVDNGTGMTCDEFISRWPQLSYNRRNEQGEEVLFPSGNQKSNRKAFGRNGKGRHAMFHFAQVYSVTTWKDGICNEFSVSRSNDTDFPFHVHPIKKYEKIGHGTMLSAETKWNPFQVQVIRDLLGSKFISDPSFSIFVNQIQVQLTDLKQSEMVEIDIPHLGTLKIQHIYAQKAGRTTKQHGVAWWVKKRLVGEPSWRGFDDIPYLDGRRAQARHHTFVVEVDFLEDKVNDDWSGFKDTEEFQTVQDHVRDYIADEIFSLMQDVNQERKIAALEANKTELKDLPVASRYRVGLFIDEFQRASPAIGQRELTAAATVVSKLEKTRTGFTLLSQLAKLNPDDFDALSNLLNQWNVQEASLVLEELEKRLQLITNLERLVEDPSSDELHEIQPLFEVGLWIFGPEYEGVSFTSNRTLLTVIEDFFGTQVVKPLENPKKRPDFVALPDSTIGLYTRDSYDERGEINGIDKLLIVELKRGGFEITRKEKNQAQEYANELRKSGRTDETTEITAFVLGSRISNDAQRPIEEGNTIIRARVYNTVIKQAHARTFNLLKKIEKLRNERLPVDPEVEEVLRGPAELFSTEEVSPLTDNQTL